LIFLISVFSQPWLCYSPVVKPYTLTLYKYVHVHVYMYVFIIPIVYSGQRYDKEGVLTPWWSNISIDAFRERKECFVDQYSKYELFGYKVSRVT